MKKLLILSLLLILTFSLAACGDGSGKNSGSGLGDITVGGSKKPASSSRENTSAPETSQSSQPAQSTSGTSEQPNGNIDTKLIGQWQHSGTRNLTENYFYDYFFYDDGSFEYFRRIGAGTGGADGKYKVSNGKIYFSKLYEINAIGERMPYDDIVFEYEFGNDDKGEYLLICHFNYLGENRDISSGIKFRKQ